MTDIIAEQISSGLQKLYGVVPHMSYNDLEDLRREIGLLELLVAQKQQTHREVALKSKSKNSLEVK